MVNSRRFFVRKNQLLPQGAGRLVAGAVGTILLLFFLSFARWHGTRQLEPDTTLRVLTGIDVSSPILPPPPPPTEPPPPPLKTPPLPKLDIQIDSPAPPIKATTKPDVRPSMEMASFEVNRPQQRQRMVFSLRDLDGQPRLVARPRVSFPSSLRKRGIQSGKTSLEVRIDASGKVEVLRVIESEYPELASVTKDFASRARFTPPKKDGRPVAARFVWPIVIR